MREVASIPHRIKRQSYSRAAGMKRGRKLLRLPVPDPTGDGPEIVKRDLPICFGLRRLCSPREIVEALK